MAQIIKCEHMIVRLNLERSKGMRSTSQFTTPAYIGSAVAVIMTSLFKSVPLPAPMLEPDVVAAVVGLSSAMASSIASYINAVIRERRREAEKDETE